jgi:hypothetical protein
VIDPVNAVIVLHDVIDGVLDDVLPSDPSAETFFGVTWLTSLVTPITFPRIVNSSGSSSPALYHSLSATIVLAL